MMLDGTMDPETGEWNFGGDDGPGWPMTGAEAAAYVRATGRRPKQRFRRDPDAPRDKPVFRLTKAWRTALEVFGSVANYDRYHWQIRKDGKVVADWWPHKDKWRIGAVVGRGGEAEFRDALAKAAS
jgi:hypothetical protein